MTEIIDPASTPISCQKYVNGFTGQVIIHYEYTKSGDWRTGDWSRATRNWTKNLTLRLITYGICGLTLTWRILRCYSLQRYLPRYRSQTKSLSDTL